MFRDRGLLFELEIKSVAQQEIEFVEAHRDLISALILLLMILITGLLG